MNASSIFDVIIEDSFMTSSINGDDAIELFFNNTQLLKLLEKLTVTQMLEEQPVLNGSIQIPGHIKIVQVLGLMVI